MRLARSAIDRPADRLSVTRVALAAAITATIIYVLCWSAALVAAREFPHFYARMFATEAATSAYALLAGVVWSWIGGVVAGSIAALAYNALAEGD